MKSRKDAFGLVALNVLPFSVLNGPILHTSGWGLPIMAALWCVGAGIGIHTWEER